MLIDALFDDVEDTASVTAEAAGPASTVSTFSEPSVDTVRNEIKEFLWLEPPAGMPFRIVVLEEAHRYKGQAQSELLTLVEGGTNVQGTAHRMSARFILLTNYPDKLSDPLRDRLYELHMADTPVDERAEVLQRVLDAEGIPATDREIREFADGYQSVRSMLKDAEQEALVWDALYSVRVLFPDDADVSDAVYETVRAVATLNYRGDGDGVSQSAVADELDMSSASTRVSDAVDAGVIEDVAGDDETGKRLVVSDPVQVETPDDRG